MYCKKCGAYVPDGQSVCSICGVDNSNTDSHISDELKDIVNSADDSFYDESMRKTTYINPENIQEEIMQRNAGAYPNTPPEPQQFPFNQPVDKNSGLTIAIICILIVLAIVVIVLAIVLFGGEKSYKHDSVSNATSHSPYLSDETSSTAETEPNTEISVVYDTRKNITQPATHTTEKAKESNDPVPPIYCKMSASATSTLDDQHGNSYGANNVLDENKSTCWAEGVNGDGTGQKITITCDKPVLIDTIVIDNGYCKSSDLFYDNNRVKLLKFTFDDSRSEIVQFSDGFENARRDYSPSVKSASKITVEILEVFNGEKYNDTCISGITIY